ncbi:MAG: hypothetical protein IJA69_00015, partial [Clostridia bacterium]|nr:hypothetical protein [Clostridia bacterium]
LGCVMALSVVAIGVYALTTVNLGVTGSISFIAYDKQVYIEDITLKNIVEETDIGYQTTTVSYDNYQGVYLKNSNSTVDLSGKVLQGETMEIDITLKNLKANYLKTSLSHKALPTGVLIRSTGLYMPQNTGTSAATGESRTLKIYISNQSTTTYTLDLSTVDLSITFSEVESLIHTGTRTEGSTTKTIYYVEMGTLPGTEAVDGVYTEEYLKWRYLSADGTTPYTANTAPTSVGGTYILETGVQRLTTNNTLLRNDDTGYGLAAITFQNNYQYNYNEGLTTLKGELSNVYANDYAYSTVRKYMNGQKVYKGATNTMTDEENGIGYCSPKTTSHYSDMLTDFCIDAENDLIYNRIVARNLADLYSDIWDCPEGWTKITEEQKSHYALQNGIDTSQADKFWALSAAEAKALLASNPTNFGEVEADGGLYWDYIEEDICGVSYLLRSPHADDFEMVCYIDGDGYITANAVTEDYFVARAAFNLG